MVAPCLGVASDVRWCAADVRVADRIINLDPTSVVLVVGTLYKDMPLKPNILDEFASEVCVARVWRMGMMTASRSHRSVGPACCGVWKLRRAGGALVSVQRQVAPPPVRANYCSPSDALFLEDESGRVKLSGVDALVGSFVTGAERSPWNLCS